MNVCLLCLEPNNKDCIKVNSEKWNQQNMNDLIDTHLWPMVSSLKVVTYIHIGNKKKNNFHILATHKLIIMDLYRMRKSFV